MKSESRSFLKEILIISIVVVLLIGSLIGGHIALSKYSDKQLLKEVLILGLVQHQKTAIGGNKAADTKDLENFVNSYCLVKEVIRKKEFDSRTKDYYEAFHGSYSCQMSSNSTVLSEIAVYRLPNKESMFRVRIGGHPPINVDIDRLSHKDALRPVANLYSQN